MKQGCPLSPLLFNLCLEPLFAALRKNNEEEGIIRWIQREKVQIQAQAYADDIILIADNLEAKNKLIDTTETFLRWSQMEVITKKCSNDDRLHEHIRISTPRADHFNAETKRNTGNSHWGN